MRRSRLGCWRLLPDLDGKTLSPNGAINLQYGRVSPAGREPAALGHVNRVTNDAGEEVRFVEYTDIYEAAVAAARRLSLR